MLSYFDSLFVKNGATIFQKVLLSAIFLYQDCYNSSFCFFAKVFYKGSAEFCYYHCLPDFSLLKAFS